MDQKSKDAYRNALIIITMIAFLGCAVGLITEILTRVA